MHYSIRYFLSNDKAQLPETSSRLLKLKEGDPLRGLGREYGPTDDAIPMGNKEKYTSLHRVALVVRSVEGRTLAQTWRRSSSTIIQSAFSSVK